MWCEKEMSFQISVFHLIEIEYTYVLVEVSIYISPVPPIVMIHTLGFPAG